MECGLLVFGGVCFLVFLYYVGFAEAWCDGVVLG